MAKVLERPLYEADYYAWTQEQAASLRVLADQSSNLPLDLLNLAEEVESLDEATSQPLEGSFAASSSTA